MDLKTGREWDKGGYGLEDMTGMGQRRKWTGGQDGNWTKEEMDTRTGREWGKGGNGHEDRTGIGHWKKWT